MGRKPYKNISAFSSGKLGDIEDSSRLRFYMVIETPPFHVCTFTVGCSGCVVYGP